RRINDGMGAFVAQKVVRMLAAGDAPLKRCRVGVLGLTFKENVPDLRNSRVPDIVSELASYGVAALVHDPLADAEEAKREYGIELQPLSALTDLDALVLAVPHRELVEQASCPSRFLRPGGVLIDVKAALRGLDLGDVVYWSLCASAGTRAPRAAEARPARAPCWSREPRGSSATTWPSGCWSAATRSSASTTSTTTTTSSSRRRGSCGCGPTRRSRSTASTSPTR